MGSAAEVAYARSYEGPAPGPGDRPFISPGVAWARPVVVEVHGAWLLYIRQFKPGLCGGGRFGGGGRLGGWEEGRCSAGCEASFKINWNLHLDQA